VHQWSIANQANRQLGSVLQDGDSKASGKYTKLNTAVTNECLKAIEDMQCYIDCEALLTQIYTHFVNAHNSFVAILKGKI